MNIPIFVASLKYNRNLDNVVKLSTWTKHEAARLKYNEKVLIKYVRSYYFDAKIINELIEFTDNKNIFEFCMYRTHDIIYGACKHGYVNIVKYFIDNDLSKIIDTSYFLAVSIEYKRFDVSKLLISSGAPVSNALIRQSFETRQFDILELLLPNMNQFYILLYDIFVYMIKIDNVNVVKIILEKNPDFYNPEALKLTKSETMKNMLKEKLN